MNFTENIYRKPSILDCQCILWLNFEAGCHYIKVNLAFNLLLWNLVSNFRNFRTFRICWYLFRLQNFSAKFYLLMLVFLCRSAYVSTFLSVFSTKIKLDMVLIYVIEVLLNFSRKTVSHQYGKILIARCSDVFLINIVFLFSWHIININNILKVALRPVTTR